MPAVLCSQAFAGAALVRGMGGASLPDVLLSPTSRYLVVAQRRVAVELSSSSSSTLLCVGLAALRELLPDGSLEAAGGGAVPVYVLGRDLASGGYRLAADVSGLAPEELAPALAGGLTDLRRLLSTLPPPDLALAGHAVALSTWHQVRTEARLHPSRLPVK